MPCEQELKRTVPRHFSANWSSGTIQEAGWSCRTASVCIFAPGVAADGAAPAGSCQGIGSSLEESAIQPSRHRSAVPRRSSDTDSSGRDQMVRDGLGWEAAPSRQGDEASQEEIAWQRVRW